MGSNDERIAMTVRIENDLYVRMRDFAAQCGAPHNVIMEHALEFYLQHVKVVIKTPQTMKWVKEDDFGRK